MDGGSSSAYANVDKAKKLLKRRLSYYEKNKKFNLTQLITEYVEHTNQPDKKKLIANYVDSKNVSLVAKNENSETKVSTENIFTAMSYDWMTEKFYNAESTINTKDAEKKALELCKANSCVIHSTQTITDNDKGPIILTKNEKSQTKITKKKDIAKAKEKKPKQEEFKPETQVDDNDPPVIEIAENITVYDTSYEIKGSVTDKSEKIFIEIDGQPVQVKDGKFYVKRYSPIDEQIKIIAIDQWGNKSKEKLVNIKINLEETLVAESIEPQNPSKLTGKTSDSKVALIIGIEKYSDPQMLNLQI